MPVKRNYTKERLTETKKRKEDRKARGRARYAMIKKGKAKKGDGKHVDHKRPLRKGGTNAKKNLRVRSAKANSSDNGHKKGEKQKRKKR